MSGPREGWKARRFAAPLLRAAWARLSGDAGGVWIRAARKAGTRDEALELVLRAAKAGHPAGHYELGLAHWEGLLGGDSASGEAVAAFLRAAEAGHGGAMLMLGEAARAGRGVPRNLPKALDWHLRAAEAGNRCAAHRVAQAFEQGEGAAANVGRAAIWRELAGPGPMPELPRSCAAMLGDAARGEAVADAAEDALPDEAHPGFAARLPEYLGPLLLFTAAGFLLIIGLLVAAVNVLGFIRWFKTGNLIFAISTVPLYIMPGCLLAVWGLLRGKDVDRRARRQSTSLLRRAEAGDQEACYRLGLAFLHGDPEHPKDEDTARRWLRRGAELGHAEAAVQFAQMLRWGAGGPKDLNAATTWLRHAAQAGSAEARRLLGGMAPEAGSYQASDILGSWSAPLTQATH
jgi:hypothetical protein